MKKKGKFKKRVTTPVSLVIPVFNNATTLTKQLKECISVLDRVCMTYEILISDDKSFDESKDHLKFFSKNKKIKIFYQKENLGIAKNILFLYKKANYPLILLFSIDGDWNPQDIGKLINREIETDAGIVVGKRNISDYSFLRKIVSFSYNLLPILLFRVKTYDTGSIKIFKKEIINTIPIVSKSVSFESEMLIKATKKGYTIEAIPVSYRKQKTNSKSGVNMQVIISSMIDLLKLRIQKI